LEKKELKKFKSILVEEGQLPNGARQERSFAIEYVRGVDLHFLILKHAAEVLKICKTIGTQAELNQLTKIDDSIRLCTLLLNINKMTRLYPNKNMYSDMTAPAARKPKSVTAAPAELQTVNAAGFYMWTARETGVWKYIYLGLIISGLMFFLLFRVWPEWLRLAVWYLSWYVLVFLVSVWT
jgi:hypothetical protein